MAEQVFGGDFEFGELNVLNSPYSEFELPIRLYGAVEIILTYDRSILGIAVKTKTGNTWIDDMTDQKVYDGFESCKPENLLHNFQVLKEVAQQMIRKGEA